MHTSIRFVPVARTLMLVAAVIATSSAGAASHCKGMSENACSGDASCTWVQGYTRKDGRQVSSHCKLARGKRADKLSVSRAAPVTGD